MCDLGIFGLGIPQVNHITLHPYTQSSLCHMLLSHYSLCPLLPSSTSPLPSTCHSNARRLCPHLHIKRPCAHEPILGLGAGFMPLKDQKLTLCHFGSHSVDSVSQRSPWYHHLVSHTKYVWYCGHRDHISCVPKTEELFQEHFYRLKAPGVEEEEDCGCHPMHRLLQI